MVCKNMQQWPKSAIARSFIGAKDKCVHLKKMKGINIHLSHDECPLKDLCKYYEEVENG